jgi:glyoxylase-like metal-dependent hydrolase (beta-lactamase superfamily II)
MIFELFTRPIGDLDTNCVIIANHEAKKIVVFDAPFDRREGFGAIDFVKEFSEAGYAVEALLFTHGHFDHIMGVAPIAKIAGRIYAHEGDRRFFTNPELMAGWVSPDEWKFLKPTPITHWLKGGEILSLIGLTIEARHTPGHSPGGVAYCLEQLGSAIVGDTIFKESVGRTNLPCGSWDNLINSISSQLFNLKDDTKLYPGHGLMTTISHEKRYNKFLKN